MTWLWARAWFVFAVVVTGLVDAFSELHRRRAARRHRRRVAAFDAQGRDRVGL